MSAKRRSFRFVSALAALLMTLLVSATGYANSEKLIFASAKEMLIYQIRNAAPADPSKATSTFSFTLEELKGDELPELAPFVNVPVQVSATTDLGERLMHVGLSTEWEGKPLSGGVYLDNNRMIVQAADFQPIVEPLIATQFPDMPLAPLPQYLVVDVPEVTDLLEEIWLNADESTARSMELYDSEAVRELMALVVEAIPDKYIRRSGINGITIAFNHDGLVDIARSMVSYGYAHQEEVADTVAAVVAEVAAAQPELAANPEEVRSEILAAFSALSEEEALAEVKRTLVTDSPVRIGYTRLTIYKELFGPVTTKLTGSVTVFNPDDRESSLTVRYAMNSEVSPGVTLTLPTLDESNAMGIEEWFLQAEDESQFSDMDRR